MILRPESLLIQAAFCIFISGVNGFGIYLKNAKRISKDPVRWIACWDRLTSFCIIDKESGNAAREHCSHWRGFFELYWLVFHKGVTDGSGLNLLWPWLNAHHHKNTGSEKGHKSPGKVYFLHKNSCFLYWWDVWDGDLRNFSLAPLFSIFNWEQLLLRKPTITLYQPKTSHLLISELWALWTPMYFMEVEGGKWLCHFYCGLLFLFFWMIPIGLAQ